MVKRSAWGLSVVNEQSGQLQKHTAHNVQHRLTALLESNVASFLGQSESNSASICGLYPSCWQATH